MSHELFLAIHEEAMAEAAEIDGGRARWYAEAEAHLGGACPLEEASEGGYCAPIMARNTETLAGLLADNELACGCLPNHQHGPMCTDGLAPVVELPATPAPVSAGSRRKAA